MTFPPALDVRGYIYTMSTVKITVSVKHQHISIGIVTMLAY